VRRAIDGPATGESPEGDPKIRVLLAEGVESARISVNEGLSVSSAGLVLLESTGKCAVLVAGNPPQIEVTLEPSGKVAVAEGEITVTPRGNPAFAFDGVSYEGTVRVLSAAGGGLNLVNTVPLETYLEGVLPHEMGNPGTDGYDALKRRPSRRGRMRWSGRGPMRRNHSTCTQVFRIRCTGG